MCAGMLKSPKSMIEFIMQQMWLIVFDNTTNEIDNNVN